MRTVKGALVAVSADNLASQALGGYKGLQSAFRKCRQCMATNDTMQIMVRLYIHVHVYVYVNSSISKLFSSPMKSLLHEPFHSMQNFVHL